MIVISDIWQQFIVKIAALYCIAAMCRCWQKEGRRDAKTFAWKSDQDEAAAENGLYRVYISCRYIVVVVALPIALSPDVT